MSSTVKAGDDLRAGLRRAAAAQTVRRRPAAEEAAQVGAAHRRHTLDRPGALTGIQRFQIGLQRR
jgi:hypothetical protein